MIHQRHQRPQAHPQQKFLHLLRYHHLSLFQRWHKNRLTSETASWHENHLLSETAAGAHEVHHVQKHLAQALPQLQNQF